MTLQMKGSLGHVRGCCCRLKTRRQLRASVLKPRTCTCHRMMADGTVPHVDVHDDKGRTLLHLAVMQGNLSMVHLLCTYQADVLCKSADGSTPLTIAEDCNRPTIARFLGCVCV